MRKAGSKMLTIYKLLLGFVLCPLLVQCMKDDHQVALARSNPGAIQGTTLIRGTHINLRFAADINSASLGLMQGGNRVKVLERQDSPARVMSQDGNWIRVKVLTGPLSGKEGWVFSAYLLSDSESPFTLLEQVERSTNDPSERLRLLRSLDAQFPELLENPNEVLYTFKDHLHARIAVNECWSSKLTSARSMKSREELVSAFKSLIRSFDQAAFLSMTSCEFVYLESCGGSDAMPIPFSERDVGSVARIISSLDSNSDNSEHCYRSSDKTMKCFYISNYANNFYINTFCTRH